VATDDVSKNFDTEKIIFKKFSKLNQPFLLENECAERTKLLMKWIVPLLMVNERQ